jgi:hypothetical protein
MSEFKMPTEVVELPSKGLIYPEDNPLASGTVEMKYMTAKEEDILTNQSYIQKGIVIDKLLQSLIVSKINYDDLIVGDKNAILIAARVLGYGAEYSFQYDGKEATVDLSTLEPREFNESLFTRGKNEFEFELPSTGNKITFKLLTGHDEKAIDRELAGLKKIDKNNAPELTTRLKHMITSINGDTEKKTIREFVDNYLLAKDSRALREYIRQIQPDIDMTFIPEGEDTPVTVPMTATFLYPDL